MPSWQVQASVLRISEALAVRFGPVDEDQTAFIAADSVIKVRASIYRGEERRGTLKTSNARRDVDLDSKLSAAIAKFIEASGIRPGQFLFQSATGNVACLQTLTMRLKRRAVPGFHAFRRFRATRLRFVGVSEDVIRFWLGHAGAGITDRYSKLAEYTALRKEWATRAGLGFDLENTGHPAPQKLKPPKPTIPRKPHWKARAGVAERAKVAEAKRKSKLAPWRVPVEPPTEPVFVAGDVDLPDVFQPVVESQGEEIK
jgi:hypothetical protein